MAVVFAPQYRDPNEELKYYMLQMAEMLGQRRREKSQQRKMTEFAESLSPTQTPTAGGQSVFTRGGFGALKEGWLGGQPTKTGMIQSAQLTPVQLLQKALTAELPMQQALGVSRLGAQGQQGFTLGSGQTRFGPQGRPMATMPEQAKTTQASSVITDPNNPERAIRVRDTFDQQGNLVNRQILGEATLAEKIGGVAAEGLQKPTQTKLEKDIIDLQTTLIELDAIDKQFNEEFFTYKGKGIAYFTALAEKAKIPIGETRKQFLGEKTKFFADAKRVFLKFRKFITGVAGGIEEFKEIAKATIDPESDSPTQFQAKMKSMRDNARRTQNILLAIRNSGLNPNDLAVRKQVFRGLSLKSVPVEVPGNVTLDTLSTDVPSKTEIPEDIKNMSDEELKRLAGIE